MGLGGAEFIPASWNEMGVGGCSGMGCGVIGCCDIGVIGDIGGWMFPKDAVIGVGG